MGQKLFPLTDKRHQATDSRSSVPSKPENTKANHTQAHYSKIAGVERGKVLNRENRGKKYKEVAIKQL